MSTNKLAEQIEEWFKTVYALNKSKNFWNQNRVAKTIKDNLQTINHWKQLKRWTPPSDQVKKNKVKWKENQNVSRAALNSQKH